jgi:hypothetical protein
MLRVTKRVLLAGSPGTSRDQVVLSNRANNPALLLSRSCVLRGFTLTNVGFTEAIRIASGSTTTKPILQDLAVACSGDDGVTVSGKAQPLIRGCDIKVCVCGLVGWGRGGGGGAWGV